MVSIEDNPDTMTGLAAGTPDKFIGLKYYFDIPTHLLEQYHDSAVRILERARLGPKHESEIAEVHLQTQGLQKPIDAMAAEAPSPSEPSSQQTATDKQIVEIQM